MSDTFPENFMCIGNKTFEWVFVNRPAWVEFTLDEMIQPTGLLLKWQRFCKEKKLGKINDG